MQRSTARSFPRKAAPLLILACVATLALGCKPATFHGTAYEPPARAPEVVLRTANGGQFSLADQKGSVVFLYFGYTHCPDVCPTTLSDWKRIKTALGRDASRVRFVFISVDPARDDPATLQHYVATFDPSFIGATSDSVTLARIETSFHVTSGREETGSANGYAVIHPSQTFVIDKQGNLRLLYSFGTNTDDIISDIRQLLRGA
jgi:protein SCO1/2